MDNAKLKIKDAELRADHPDWTDQQVADNLNAETVTQTYSRFVTYRTLLSELPIEQAMTIIAKIKATAAADPDGVLGVIAPSLEDTAEGCGIDMSNANARTFIDGLVATKVLTADEGAAVKGMAERLISWATANGLPPVGPHHVEYARSN